MSFLTTSIFLATVMALGDDGANPPLAPEMLEAQLKSEDPKSLAAQARRLGDARRGATVFYQPALMCVGCHSNDEPSAQTGLGPDLAALGKDFSDTLLIESILEPSKTIKKGYETVTIVTDDGRTLSGLLAQDRPDAIVLRDFAQGGRPLAISKERIEQQTTNGPSLMPVGLVNALGSRQQFLDLVRFLMEIAEFGPTRARSLRPDPALLPPPLPDYERNLDHAGLLGALGMSAFERGRAIYDRVCANCHGTKDRPGSLPSAPRFGAAALKNGSDPYRMYQTLTVGFGQMAAQTWMVPSQKYDAIHYIREAYFKPGNAASYTRVDRSYLDRLPKGTSHGPPPAAIEPWIVMDYGPSMSATLEVSDDGSNIASKGVAIRLDAGPGGIARGRAWVVYDHDTMRLAAAWTGQGFIDWNGINFNGRHQVHPRLVGKVQFTNGDAPGWSNPENESFADLRERARDGRPYGPLPRRWTHYKGFYRHGDQVILAYTVGMAKILEQPGLETDPKRPDRPIFTRTLEIGPAPYDLTMRVAPAATAVSLAGGGQAIVFERDGISLLRVPGSGSTRRLKVLMSNRTAFDLQSYAKSSPPAIALEPLTKGGPKRWPELVKTQDIRGQDDRPFAVDTLTIPTDNPWLCQMRPTGFDFMPSGREVAACTWDGDVWSVSGIETPGGGLTWRRIASGLFQPLGLKIVSGQIYVACRDQIVCLRDLNRDGETDFYENFNSDHQVTEHFHEFAMGLQTDAEGNFYYAKAARHGLPALVPHHGTLLRVSKDGTRTDILATGFRAPNGVCVNPDGTFFLSDQEGFWTPKNRINWVKRGGFYGNMWGYHSVTDTSDSTMEPPVCWITNDMDRSPAELVWVESSRPAWNPLRGALLSLSYGNGKIFVVPHEIARDKMQGGVCPLPIPPLPTGIMRGRFNPIDGDLYTCGLFAWAGDRTQPGGYYRIRATGKPMVVPIELHARHDGLAITFTEHLKREDSDLTSHYTAKTWALKRSVNYGSDHYDEHSVLITKATLSSDGRTVLLEIPNLRPTWCMEVTYDLQAASPSKA